MRAKMGSTRAARVGRGPRAEETTMTVKRLRMTAMSLAACSIFLSAPQAAPARHGGFHRGFELNPYLTFTDFDDKSEINDELGAGFRFGYLYNTSHEIEFLFNDVTTHDVLDPNQGVDVSQFQVAYVYNFTSHDIVPYVTAGLGFVHTDDQFLGTETDPVLGLGAGIRFFLGRVVYARFEARHNRFGGDGTVYLNNEGFTFNEYTFGIGWRFPT